MLVRGGCLGDDGVGWLGTCVESGKSECQTANGMHGDDIETCWSVGLMYDKGNRAWESATEANLSLRFDSELLFRKALKPDKALEGGEGESVRVRVGVACLAHPYSSVYNLKIFHEDSLGAVGESVSKDLKRGVSCAKALRTCGW